MIALNRDNDRSLPHDYAERKARRMWERAGIVQNDRGLMSELGFPKDDFDTPVLMLVTAGDRLHPTKGFDFLGKAWEGIAERERFRLLNERETAVEAIVREVLDVLITDGLESAQQRAKAASRFQVVYLASSEADTTLLIQSLVDVGLGANELSDCDFGKRGRYLYFRWDENLSYFIPGDLD